jgi:hypothetical protein
MSNSMLEQKYLKCIKVNGILPLDAVHKSDRKVSCSARNSLKSLTVFGCMLTKNYENP